MMYFEPELQVISIVVEDVIRTSIIQGEDPLPPTPY